MIITSHAYDRVKERLGVTKQCFEEWVSSTRQSWIQVNAKYFLERGVLVSQKSNLFVTPWTFDTHLCICMSENNTTLKTIYPYTDKKPQLSLKHEIENLLQECLLKALQKKEITEKDITKTLRLTTGTLFKEVLEAYKNDEITLKSAQTILCSKESSKNQLLQNAIKKGGIL